MPLSSIHSISLFSTEYIIFNSSLDDSAWSISSFQLASCVINLVCNPCDHLWNLSTCHSLCWVAHGLYLPLTAFLQSRFTSHVANLFWKFFDLLLQLIQAVYQIVELDWGFILVSAWWEHIRWTAFSSIRSFTSAFMHCSQDSILLKWLWSVWLICLLTVCNLLQGRGGGIGGRGGEEGGGGGESGSHRRRRWKRWPSFALDGSIPFDSFSMILNTYWPISLSLRSSWAFVPGE